jgi:hypothetical protein
MMGSSAAAIRVMTSGAVTIAAVVATNLRRDIDRSIFVSYEAIQQAMKPGRRLRASAPRPTE